MLCLTSCMTQSSILKCLLVFSAAVVVDLMAIYVVVICITISGLLIFSITIIDPHFLAVSLMFITGDVLIYWWMFGLSDRRGER